MKTTKTQLASTFVPWRWRVFPSRLLVFALLWWILTDGASTSWLVGVPAVVLAGISSTLLMPPLRVSFIGAVKFALFFGWESLRGGIDVARRALHRRLPLAPGMVDHQLRTPRIDAHVSLANTVSLLPGTLAADLDDRVLHVHALDAGTEVRDSLERSEQQIATLFQVALIAPERDRGPS